MELNLLVNASVRGSNRLLRTQPSVSASKECASLPSVKHCIPLELELNVVPRALPPQSLEENAWNCGVDCATA
jgi:hypothetical protein